MTIISMDKVNTLGGDGYDISSTDAVTVNPGILVASTNTSSGNGVVVSASLSSLDNFGQVFSVSFDAVDFFTADNGYLVNEQYGVIFGGMTGVDLSGNGDNVKNLGTIVGRRVGVSFDGLSNGTTLSNFGSVLGYSVGVYATNEGGMVYNSGKVSSYRSGISVGSNNALTLSITNTVTGVISGNVDAIDTFLAGGIVLNNGGTINGKIDLESLANDIVINHGTINGNIYLYSGNDVFNGKGGRTSGIIFCGSSDDRVTAGRGNVQIDAGRGNSTLTAGPGHDQFIFNDALVDQVTRIIKFNPNRDKIVLSAGDFAGINPIGHALAAADFHVGAHATSHAQHIIYNPANGFLYYDPDGKGGMPQTHFATLSPHLQMTHTAFLVEA